MILQHINTSSFKQKIIRFSRISFTGDKKWVFYDNVQRKKLWTGKNEFSLATPKAELHGRKFMLFALWDHRGIIPFEFLNCNQSLDTNLYYQNPAMWSSKKTTDTRQEKKRLFMIIQSHIKQESRRKNIEFRLDCSTRLTIFAIPCSKWFSPFSFFTKFSERKKNLQKLRWKRW